MKKFLVFLVITVLLFSSCSNTEQSPVPDTKEVIPKSTLTFTYKEFIPGPGEDLRFSPVNTITNNFLIYSSESDGRKRYGYMDMELNKVSDPIYCSPPVFHNGLACGVLEGRWLNYAVIDENLVHREVDGTIPFMHEGEWVYVELIRHIYKHLDEERSTFDYYNIFSPDKYKGINIDEALVPVKSSNGMYGYKRLLDVYYGKVSDDEGFQIPPMFARAYEFSDGLARVRNDEEFGYIDTEGNFVIGYQFEQANDFKNGMALVGNPKDGEIELLNGVPLDNTEWYVINTIGSMITERKYRRITEFEEGFAYVNKGEFKNAGAMIDETGKEHFADKFRIAYGFNNGISLVQTALGAFYYIDKDGHCINGRTYDNAGEFSDGLAVVLIGEEYGYIGKDGVVKIEPIYEYATSFNSGFAVVKLPGESMSYVIDKMGNKYLENLNLHELSQFNKDGYALGYSMVDDENKIYYLIHLEN